MFVDPELIRFDRKEKSDSSLERSLDSCAMTGAVCCYSDRPGRLVLLSSLPIGTRARACKSRSIESTRSITTPSSPSLCLFFPKYTSDKMVKSPWIITKPQ